MLMVACLQHAMDKSMITRAMLTSNSAVQSILQPANHTVSISSLRRLQAGMLYSHSHLGCSLTRFSFD